MRKALIFIASSLILASSAVGCAATSDDASSGEEDISRGKPPMNVSETVDGQRIVVNEGANLVLSLSQNGSTGYAWMVTSSGGLADPASKIDGVTSTPGASATRVLTWKTTGKVGEHDITVIYQRPWAELSPPAKTISFKVVVKAKAAGDHCGGFAGFECASNEFCEYGAVQRCGMADGMGSCKPRPAACPQNFQPVCGCDGKTYSNACMANGAGVGVSSNATCAPAVP